MRTVLKMIEERELTMEQDYQNRFIKVIADDEECVFIIPTKILKQANIDVGDKCFIVAENNELIIKKAGDNSSC